MTHPIDSFITRWEASGAAERANYQLFLTELCDLLEAPHPEPTEADDRRNAYVFEKSVPLPGGTTGFIDLYKRGCFVLEAKQGSDQTAGAASTARLKKGTAVRGTAGWDTAMEAAKNQADRYARSLPAAEIVGGRPPFLVVVDVGNSIALYSDFTRHGGYYVPFPTPHSYRINLADLRRDDIRARLRQVWLTPAALDPSRRSARVTRDIASHLAELARQLEQAAHSPEAVAGFLMRCLFTMFAEDVGLLPGRSFTQLLTDIRRAPATFQPMVEHLWQTMNSGGFSVILRQEIPEFNGGLFADPVALPLTVAQVDLLLEAARADWREVEPAIFGTLLERALDTRERHALGAHYTPRAYVERLVQPAVIEPLRAEWEGVKAAATLLAEDGRDAKAVAEVEAFQRRLASVRILDPACGSANFLYVTLALLKLLEAEVLELLKALGPGQMTMAMEGVMVTPRQFLGIELNPRAAAIAELVLWIGYLQWHFRTYGQTQPPPAPIIHNYHNIECRDAVLAWEAREPLLDDAGRPVTRWDGQTMKVHPVTGAEVPDESARTPVYRYHNPRPADWPAADFVVGNPPFIGTARMREALGDGYTEALRRTYPHVPNSADLVMFWWDKAADLARAGQLERFGLITTNSLRQTFNRRVLQHHLAQKQPLSLLFAVPDHPWADAASAAAVRIAMTVGAGGDQPGLLQTVTAETPGSGDSLELELASKRGKIQADLTIGADVAGAMPLQANSGVSNRGFELGGAGFIVTPEQAQTLGLGRIAGLENHIRDYRNGRDVTAIPRGVQVIDLYGLTENEVRTKYPEIYQWVFERVKPERDQNRSKTLRENWWLHRRLREDLRDMLRGLTRYIATVETAKHRFFVFLDESILPDNKLINIALDDAYFLGVLSSRIHVAWALAAGGWLGVGNDPVYVKTRCFETFPFPDAGESHKERIRALAEELDAHRKRQQAQHPKLTLTDMYNVLEKLRAADVGHASQRDKASPGDKTSQRDTGGPGDPPYALTAKEKTIHQQGLVSILRQLHDDLDAAVFDAYGWSATLSDDEILERLVALNAARAAEEAAGQIRWLRPAYQAPDAAPVVAQPALLAEEAAVIAPAQKQPWPASMAEQAQAVLTALHRFEQPVTAAQLSAAFERAPKARLVELLDTLVSLGQAQQVAGDRYAG